MTLLQLPAEVLVLWFGRLDARSLTRAVAICAELYRDKLRSIMTHEVEVLRQCAAARGHFCPERLAQNFSSWTAHIAWLECRCNEAWSPIAAGFRSCFLSRMAAGS